MKIILTLSALIGFVFGGLTLVEPAGAAPTQTCFAETGFCIAGPIAAYWQANGGLPVFGYPISDLKIEQIEGWSGPVQWFERDRLEDHSNEAQGVLAGRLGAQVLEAQGRPWQTLPGGPSGALTGCQFFAETKHWLCEPYRSYWAKNGGLARFGYPVSEIMSELLIDPTNNTRRPFPVQYFERRRMEEHTEYGDSRVLLGLLGTQARRYAGCEPADLPLQDLAAAKVTELGCPTWNFPATDDGVRASQPFEGGQMLWVKGGYRQSDLIYIFWREGDAYRWRMFRDGWTDGQPDRGGETPPAGRYEPQRGFGKVWREHPEIRALLGWGTQPEQGMAGPYQHFRNATILFAGPGLAYQIDQGAPVGDGSVIGQARQLVIP